MVTEPANSNFSFNNENVVNDKTVLPANDISPLVDKIELYNNKNQSTTLKIYLHDSDIVLVKEFKDTSITIANAIDYTKSIINKNKAVFENYIEATKEAKKYGYTLISKEVPALYQMIAFAKTMRKGLIRIELNNDALGFVYNAKLKIYIDDAKNIAKILPDGAMFKNTKLEGFKFKVEEHGNTLVVSLLEMKPTLSIFSDAILVYNNIRDYGHIHLIKYLRAKNIVKLTDEVAILEFLYGVFTDDPLTNPSLFFGHTLDELPKIFLKWKIDLNDAKLSNDAIIAELFKRGLIWLDKDGNITIKGKKIKDVIRDSSVSLDVKTATSLENSVRNSLINSMGIEALKTYVKREEKISDKATALLLPDYVLAKDLLSPVNNKKLIEIFSQEKRKEIIMKKMQTSEALKLYKYMPQVFENFENEFDRKVMENHEENEGYFSYYIFRKHTGLVNIPGAKLVITNDDSYFIIDNLYVKAISNKKGKISFLITDKKVTAVSSGRNLEEAISKFNREYEMLKRVLYETKEAENINFGLSVVKIPKVEGKMLEIEEKQNSEEETSVFS